MKYNLIVLLLLASYSVFAQKQKDITLPAIPYSLHWLNTPKSYTIKDSCLTISAGPETNMFRSPRLDFICHNAPILLFTPQKDFELSAQIEFGCNGMWDAGALVVYNDSLNWIKYCFEKDYTYKNRVVTVVTKGTSDDCNSMEIIGNKVFYKIVKGGNVIVLSYSINGTDWLVVRHVRFDAGNNYRIGFLAQSPVGSECSATFSHIKYVEGDNVDPYVGVQE